MFTTLIVVAVIVFVFKKQVLGIIEPVLELWTRTFSVANTYMKSVEEDLKRTTTLTDAEKKHNAKTKAETLKEQGISIEDLDID